MMKIWPLFVLLIFSIPASGQDCSGKILAARASKDTGNYRLALAQLSAAAGSCGEVRRAEIEKEILDIYDRIERLKDDALIARELANKEAERAKASEQTAAKALADARNANRIAQTALDSLKIVLSNLEQANADKVRLILTEVERDQEDENFEDALDKIRTARILNSLSDDVDRAYQNLSQALLNSAQRDLQRGAYRPALVKIRSAESLKAQPEAVDTAWQTFKDFLFTNSRLDILHTEYDSANEKIKTLHSLQVPADTVAHLWLETAFCYAETNHLNPAAGLLDSVARLRNNRDALLLLQDFAGKRPDQQLRLLRQVRQMIDSQQDALLTDRYFPADFSNIPGGAFTLGSVTTDKNPGICPVVVAPFHLSTKEVTFFEFDLFCASTKRSKPADNGWGREQRPVVDIDWYDAVEYCNWRSRQAGLQEVYTIDSVSGNSKKREPDAPKNWKIECNWSANGYRLPSEAEWEFAAGKGQAHQTFGWGEGAPASTGVGNVADETARVQFPAWEIFGGYTDGYAYTAPTGSFAPGAFGLFDMTGNVWEWCWDWYRENYCRANKDKSAPHGPDSGDNRILRGGSWGSFPRDCFVSNRFFDKPDNRNFSIGFRLAKN